MPTGCKSVYLFRHQLSCARVVGSHSLRAFVHPLECGLATSEAWCLPAGNLESRAKNLGTDELCHRGRRSSIRGPNRNKELQIWCQERFFCQRGSSVRSWGGGSRGLNGGLLGLFEATSDSNDGMRESFYTLCFDQLSNQNRDEFGAGI